MSGDSPFTDPRWRKDGGLPEATDLASTIRAERLSDLADELRAREMPDGRQAWPSAMGTTGTITPPARPGLTTEQADKLADVLGDLVNWLRSRG